MSVMWFPEKVWIGRFSGSIQGFLGIFRIFLTLQSYSNWRLKDEKATYPDYCLHELVHHLTLCLVVAANKPSTYHTTATFMYHYCISIVTETKIHRRITPKAEMKWADWCRHLASNDNRVPTSIIHVQTLESDPVYVSIIITAEIYLCKQQHRHKYFL